MVKIIVKKKKDLPGSLIMSVIQHTDQVREEEKGRVKKERQDRKKEWKRRRRKE